MMNKKLFFLASAMPLALWLQGCKDKKKDGKKPEDTKKPGEKETPGKTDPEPKQPSTDEVHQNYFGELGSKVELIKKMVKDTSHVSFDIVDELFLPYPEEVTAYALPTFTSNHNEALSGPGAEYKELIMEFRVTYKNPQLQQRYNTQQNDVVPGSIATGSIQSAMQLKTWPTMWSGQRMYNTDSQSCETIIVDQVTVQETGSNSAERLLIIAELYHTGNKRVALPRGNPKNFAVVFMPYVDNAKDYFKVCIKTFWHIIFINHVVDLPEDTTQALYFQHQNLADKNGATEYNRWGNLVYAPQGGNAAVPPAGLQQAGVIYNDGRGSKWVPTAQRQHDTIWSTIKWMETFVQKLYDSMDSHLRRMKIEQPTVQFFKDLDLNKRADFIQWMQMTLSSTGTVPSDNHAVLRQEFVRFKQAVDLVFNGANGYPNLAAAGLTACPANTFEVMEGWNNAASPLVPIPESLAAGGNNVLCIPEWIMNPVLAKKQFVPTKEERWEEFIQTVYRWEQQHSNYIMPERININSLESYQITNLRIINPGHTSELLVEVMMVAFYHAFLQSQGQMAHLNMPERILFGQNSDVNNGVNTVGNINQHNNQDLTKNVGFKATNLLKHLTFVTPRKFVKHGHVLDFEAVAKQMIAKDVKTVEVEVVEEIDTQTKFYSTERKDTKVPGLGLRSTADGPPTGRWVYQAA